MLQILEELQKHASALSSCNMENQYDHLVLIESCCKVGLAMMNKPGTTGKIQVPIKQNCEQPLHKACDKLHSDIVYFDKIQRALAENKPVDAYIKTIEMLKRLEKTLCKVREYAIKTEGDYIDTQD